MELLHALALGALQGLAEWLPISSSAQTFLAMVALIKLKPEEALSLAFFLHGGSLFAVVIYFRRELLDILKAFRNREWLTFKFSTKSSSLASFLFFSTLSTALFGLPTYFFLKEALVNYASKANLLVGVSLVATGLLLRFSRNEKSRRKAEGSTLKDMLIAGAAQGIAVIPGISRSGITVAALILRGYHQEEALKISFLMAVPAIAGATVLESFEGVAENLSPELLLAGVFASFLFSLAGVKFLLEASRRLPFDYFCLLFGFAAIIFSL